MTQGLTNPLHVLTMLRTVGYKSAAYAISELIDNSIDAEAKNISIGIATKEVRVKKAVENISAIGVFDDGNGMDAETLENCVSIGWGTNLNDSRGKLGKFGFGLKGAALAFCRKLEVYSWQAGQEPLYTYLDYDERIKTQSNELFPPIKKNPNEDWKVFLPGDSLPSSGTLVVWSELDRIQPVRPKSLLNHLNQDLCRIFRHFMDDDDDYGVKRNIVAKHFNPMGEIVSETKLTANDPLYLLTPNNLPGHEKEQTNKIISDDKIVVKCPNNTDQEVRVICTVAFPEIQRGIDGRSREGTTDLGKHYARNQGISFVRAGREITLSDKGFFPDDTRNRWIGIEVRIPPELDTYLGITNDKQDVTFFKNFSADQIEALNDELDTTDPERANKAKLNIELHRLIRIAVSNGRKTVVDRASSSRRDGKPIVSPIPDPPKPDEPTKADEVAEEKDEATKLEEIKNKIRKQDPELTDNEVTAEAMNVLAKRLYLFENDWAGQMFLDVVREGGGLSANVNRNHKFYKVFYDHIRSMNDERAMMSLQAILVSYAKAEDMMFGVIEDDYLETLRDNWGRNVNAYIKEWVE